ncbi:MAG TPA: hypothetical protein VGL39_10680 [Jatrophihabitantaceae bacterium]
MSAPPELSLDLVVGLDYGQFYLYPSPPEHDFADVPNVVDRAIGDDGIAQAGTFLVVLSPHQNNFELALRVEVLAGEPADDLDDWSEAFLATVVAGDDGLVYESPTLHHVPIPVPAGTYLARITGRGFVARGWPGSTTAGDE